VPVIVSILTTYNGAGTKKAMRDLAMMQKQATLAGNGMAAGMLAASAKMQRAGAGMAKTGTAMSKAITLPVVAIGAVSLVAAAKFEDSMKLIQTQAGGSKADVEELSAEVLKLASAGQHGPEELATALYHLKSVGMDNKQAMDALTESERLASVGHADLEATTNAVAGAYKSGIKGAQTFGATVGTLNAIIGAGNLRMEDLNSALGTGFLVNAQQFGVSLTSVGSALAMMTSRGIPATRAAMAIKMALAGMSAPSEKAEKIMGKLGLKSRDLAVAMRNGGLLPALTMLKQKLSGLSKTDQTIALTKMFGAKSSQAILTLLGNLSDYDRTQKQVAANAGKFNELAAAQAEDASAKWAHFKSSMGAAAVQIGNALLPTAIKLADGLGAIGAWLNRLGPGTRKWVVQLAFVAAAAGPVLVIVGKLTSGIGKLIGVTGKLALAFGKGGAAAPKFARGIASAAKAITSGAGAKKLAAPFKKTGSAIADSIAAGFNASKGKLKTLIQAGAQKAASGIKLAISTVTSVAASAAGTIKDTAATVANTAAKAASAIATKAAAAAQWLLNAALTANPIGLIIAAIAALVVIFIVLWKKCAWFRDFWKAVWQEIVAIAKAAWGWMKPGIEAIWNGIKVVWNAIWTATKWVWERIGPFVVAYVKALWAGLKFWFAVIKTIVVKVWDGLEAVTRKVWPIILLIVRGAVTNIKIAVAVIKVVVAIVRTVWNAVAAVTRTVWGVIRTVVVTAIRGIVATVAIINKVRDVIRKAWQKVADVTKTIWNGLKAVVGGALDWMWDKIVAVWDKIKGVYNTIKGVFGGGSSPQRGGKGYSPRRTAKAFAAGGYVPPTPGGLAAVLAEGGEGEYVVPQSKVMHFAVAALAGRSSGSQTIINLGGIRIDNLHGTDRSAAEQLAREVAGLVEAKLTRNGLLTAVTGY